MMFRTALSIVLSLTLFGLGCGDDGGGTDDTGTGGDTSIGTDTGTPPGDTGTPPGDTGTPPGDTGTPPGDTGTPPGDTGTPPSDGGGGMGTVGSACADDDDCNGALTCLTTVGSGMFGLTFPDGYCTQMDCGGMMGTPCPAGSECYSVGVGTFGFSYCAQGCSAKSDCRMGYECTMPGFGMVSGLICTPPLGFGDGGFTP